MIRTRNIAETHRDSFTISYYCASNVANKIIGIVPVDCQLVSVQEVHGTAGSDGSAVTLSIERLRNTETSGSGNTVVNASINLKGTADTVQDGTIVTQAAYPYPLRERGINYFAAGDRVGIVITGVNTGLANMNVVLTFRVLDDRPSYVAISSSISSSPSVSSSESSSASSSASVSSSESSSASSSQSISSSVSSSESASVSESSSVSSSASSSVSSSESTSTSSSESSSESPSVSASSSESSSESPSPSA